MICTTCRLHENDCDCEIYVPRYTTKVVPNSGRFTESELDLGDLGINEELFKSIMTREEGRK